MPLLLDILVKPEDICFNYYWTETSKIEGLYYKTIQEITKIMNQNTDNDNIILQSTFIVLKI